jgi:hypothetical protein
VTPEAALLVACARRRLDSDAAARIRARVRVGLDWAAVLRLAERHRVAPLLHRQLLRACPESVPRPTLDELQRRVVRNARHALALGAELRALLTDFAAHGVPAVPYKGPVLAVAAYGQLALRVFGDLDLVVSASDMARVRERLLARGYRPQLALTERQTAMLASAGRSIGFVNPASRVVIEIHSGAALDPPLARLDHECLGEPLVSVVVAGAALPSFPPETLLVILCLHGAKHRWSRLLWICDVAELVRASYDSGRGWDWDRLLDRVRRWGTERALLLGLCLARDLLDAPVPDAVASRLADHRPVTSLTGEVTRRLFLAASGRPGALESARFQLRALDRRRDRVRYCRRVLSPSEADWTSVALPGPLSFLYYPLRLSRLVLGAARSGHHR